MDLIKEEYDDFYANPRRLRDPGSGPPRLNTNLHLRVKLNSVLFVSALQPEYIHHILNEKNKKERDVWRATTAFYVRTE